VVSENLLPQTEALTNNGRTLSVCFPRGAIIEMSGKKKIAVANILYLNCLKSSLLKNQELKFKKKVKIYKCIN